MELQKSKPSVLGEVALWLLSSSAMMLVATAVLHQFLRSGEPIGAVDAGYFVVAGFLTMTWGSWAALIWSKRRVARALMGATVVVPGVLMAVVGFWAFMNVPELFKVWRPGLLILGIQGLGAAIFAAVILGRPAMRAVRDEDPGLRRRELAAGWFLYPLITFGFGSVLAMTGMGWSGLKTVSEALTEPSIWIVASMAMAIYTTMIPASAAILSRRVARTGRLR